MADKGMTRVVEYLRRAASPRDGGSATDGQLLAFFLECHDDAALEALVRRHGPMIWGVCRRLLVNHHDAEDALQATLLVFIRKASSIRPRAMVGNWLYGVAHRTALKARTTSARKRAFEKQVMVLPEPEQDRAQPWADLGPLLDRELIRLPDKFRVAIVLCDLEGKPHKQVARQLGVPEGTLSARLARGRTLLAKRLARHGLTLSAGALAVALSELAASACAPMAVMTSTVKAALLTTAGQAAGVGVISSSVVALTEGVLKAMLLNNLNFASALVLAVMTFVGAGTATMIYRTRAAEAPAPQVDVAIAANQAIEDRRPLPADPIRSSDELRGKWSGAKDGINVDLKFDSQQAPWQAQWQVHFTKPRTPQLANESRTMEVYIGADLKCVADMNTGRLDLFLPATKKVNDSAWAPRKRVAQVQRGSEGSIELRILPVGAYDYAAVEKLVLRRVAEK
jgi:RNA polymerase sigma factor (sigma-70 family)